MTERSSDFVASPGLRFAVNPRLIAVDAPPIPEIQRFRAHYDGRHGPLIDLCQAVPGHAPPPEMLAWLAESAADPQASRYGPIFGDLALREAHAADCSAVYGAAIHPDHVAITAGCNMAFVVTMMALAGAGDAVILPTPWYFNHKMTLDMLGIAAIPLPCQPEAGFVPDPDDLKALITPQVRALVLVSPNNPTGAIYPPEVLLRFAQTCREGGIALVLDETYRDFLSTDAGAPHGLFADPAWGESLIQLYSFSKAWAIPGQRLGAILAAPAFLTEIGKVLDSVQICPARPGQIALARAIPALQGWRREKAEALQGRISLFRAALAGQNRLILRSIGAYFAYLGLAEPPPTPFAGAEALARESGILALPGAVFGPGQESHLRMAFANVDEAALRALRTRFAT